MEILRNNSDSIIDTDSLHKITALRPAVHNENRVNIYVDDEFAFSLDISQVIDFKIKCGQKVTDEDLARFRKASNFGKLYQRTLEWVLTRPRSIREARDYLKKKKYQKPEYEISDEDIKAVISRLTEKGYLDDVKFTTYYIENRFQKKGISIKRLKLELQNKGISSDLVEQALKEVGRSDEDEIQKIIAKKRARYDDDKLISYLVRQGFDFELARSSVREMD
ncbi:RecX family transcriptional regulator [Candidatus Saccharibacteria bacterium]|nr:RecX family transcriptional regulator [Candidatus Saccharibacteria bacterium]